MNAASIPLVTVLDIIWRDLLGPKAFQRRVLYLHVRSNAW